jgi:hypothetical protein
MQLCSFFRVTAVSRRHTNISGGGEVRPLTDVQSDPHFEQSSAGARREGYESCFETQIRVSHVGRRWPAWNGSPGHGWVHRKGLSLDANAYDPQDPHLQSSFLPEGILPAGDFGS